MRSKRLSIRNSKNKRLRKSNNKRLRKSNNKRLRKSNKLRGGANHEKGRVKYYIEQEKYTITLDGKEYELSEKAKKKICIANYTTSTTNTSRTGTDLILEDHVTNTNGQITIKINNVEYKLSEEEKNMICRPQQATINEMDQFDAQPASYTDPSTEYERQIAHTSSVLNNFDWL